MSDQFANFTKNTKAPGDLVGASEDVPRVFTDQALTGALAAASAVAGSDNWMFGTETPTRAKAKAYRDHLTEWAQFNRDNPIGETNHYILGRASWLKGIQLGFVDAEMPVLTEIEKAYNEVPPLTQLAFEMFNTTLNRASDGMVIKELEAVTRKRNERMRAEHEAETAAQAEAQRLADEAEASSKTEPGENA